VDGRPRTMGLRELILVFLKHRFEVVTRRTQFELRKAEARAHVLEGLLIALANIDAVVALIRASKDPETALTGLMTTFGLSEIQGKAILDMRLQRLTGLESAAVRTEHQELQVQIAYYRGVLADPGQVYGIIKEELQSGFAYGIPEINRAQIRDSRCVAAAGCFATSAILSCWPLARGGRVAGTIIIDGKTGSSGSGSKPGEKTHHPFRAGAFFAYEMFHHRHAPEIRQALGGAEVLFQPHSAPMVRGVFTTSYVPLAKEMSEEELLGSYRSAYEGSSFVRISKGTSNVAHVRGSNFIDLGLNVRGRMAIVFGAIDNLLKGGASQGVQCMNLMMGFDEDEGLNQLPAIV